MDMETIAARNREIKETFDGLKSEADELIDLLEATPVVDLILMRDAEIIVLYEELDEAHEQANGMHARILELEEKYGVEQHCCEGAHEEEQPKVVTPEELLEKAMAEYNERMSTEEGKAERAEAVKQGMESFAPKRHGILNVEGVA